MKYRRKIQETLAQILMGLSLLIVIGSLVLILGTVIWKGLPALNLAMLTQTPKEIGRAHV